MWWGGVTWAQELGRRSGGLKNFFSLHCVLLLLVGVKSPLFGVFIAVFDTILLLIHSVDEAICRASQNFSLWGPVVIVCGGGGCHMGLGGLGRRSGGLKKIAGSLVLFLFFNSSVYNRFNIKKKTIEK